MPTTLYVDHIRGNYGNPIGHVIDLQKIKTIWELIDVDVNMITDELTKSDNVQHICRAGRYFVITHIMLDKPEYKYQMSLTDIKNDHNLAISIIGGVQPSLMQLANKLINQINQLSDDELNKYEMAVAKAQ